MISLFGNLTCLNLLAISTLLDISYPFFVVYIYQLIRCMSRFFLSLLLIQTCIFRFWVDFVWKSIRSINDNFVMFYITVMNSLVSIVLAAGVIWNAEGMKETWRISHNRPLLMMMTFIDHESPLRFVCMMNLCNKNLVS